MLPWQTAPRDARLAKLQFLARLKIEAAIEGLVSLLDRMDGDPDFEPSFANTMPGHLDEAEEECDDEASLGWSPHILDQDGPLWAGPRHREIDREDENEHGGDVQDERHDGEDEDAAEDSDTGIGDVEALRLEEWERPGGKHGRGSSITTEQRQAVREIGYSARRMQSALSGGSLFLIGGRS